MLAGREGHRRTFLGLQVERTDIATFLLDTQHAPGQPLALALTLLQALFGFTPGAGHQAGGSVLLEGPTQRHRSRADYHLLDVQGPDPLGAFEGADQRAVDNHLGAPGNLQHIARGEVDEQQAGNRVGQQIAEGIEMQVAGVVRNRQAIAFDPDETGATTAVGHVHGTLAIFLLDVTGDKEGVGVFDHGAGRGIEYR